MRRYKVLIDDGVWGFLKEIGRVAGANMAEAKTQAQWLYERKPEHFNAGGPDRWTLEFVAAAPKSWHSAGYNADGTTTYYNKAGKAIKTIKR